MYRGESGWADINATSSRLERNVAWKVEIKIFEKYLSEMIILSFVSPYHPVMHSEIDGSPFNL